MAIWNRIDILLKIPINHNKNIISRSCFTNDRSSPETLLPPPPPGEECFMYISASEWTDAPTPFRFVCPGIIRAAIQWVKWQWQWSVVSDDMSHIDWNCLPRLIDWWQLMISLGTERNDKRKPRNGMEGWGITEPDAEWLTDWVVVFKSSNWSGDGTAKTRRLC